MSNSSSNNALAFSNSFSNGLAKSNSSRTLADMIENSQGKFVSCSFVKKDGTVRNLVGRMGVTKHLKGGKKTVSTEQYVTIFDTQKQGYRSINRDSILSIRTCGVEAVAVK